MGLIEDYLKVHEEYSKLFPDAAKDGKLTTVYEVGSFYELYATEDPPRGPPLGEVCQILSILKTRRDKKAAVPGVPADIKNPLLAGFTAHSLSKYLPMLLERGHTVVQVSQVTPPPAPKREVVAVHSPSTSPLAHRGHEAQDLVCLVAEELPDGEVISGVCRMDLTTGRSSLAELGTVERLCAWASKVRPKEVVIHARSVELQDRLKKDLALSGPHAAPVHCFLSRDFPSHHLPVFQNAYLETRFATGPVSPLECFGLAKSPLAALAWVHACQFAELHDANLLCRAPHPRLERDTSELRLDKNAISDLRILPRPGRCGESLLGCVQETITAQGSRELRRRLTCPTRNLTELQRRYDLVDRLSGCGAPLRASLRGVLDVERLHRKWARGRMTPIDWCRLMRSYEYVTEVCGVLAPVLSNHTQLAVAEEVRGCAGRLVAQSRDLFDPDATAKFVRWCDLELCFVRPGVSSALDAHVGAVAEADRTMAEIKSEVESHLAGAKVSLRTDRDNWVITTTKKRSQVLKRQSDKWFIRSTTTMAKVTTQELDRASSNRQSAVLKIRSLARRVFYEKTAEMLASLDMSLLDEMVRFISDIDVAQGGATIAKKYRYCRPGFISGTKGEFHVKQLRHPVIERFSLTEAYTPHDLDIGGDSASGICLFAPNAAGKSTLMSALGLSTILAQAGLFVPASEFSFVPVDGVFTRMNAVDSVGVSSFMAEMLQLRTIVHLSTPLSLVLSDEACNMTEGISALSISTATLVHLIHKSCPFLFSTHLHDLSVQPEVTELSPRLALAHLEVLVDPNTGALSYSRALLPGCGERVYGLKIARHVLGDAEFWEVARSVQGRILGERQPRKTRYNPKAFIESCEVCKKKKADHTHHILFQSDADDEGFHGHQHKHAAPNLVGLCENCHGKVHSGGITISGWSQTTDGRELLWSRRKARPLTSPQRRFILATKGSRTRREAADAFREKFSRHVGLSTISRIWNS